MEQFFANILSGRGSLGAFQGMMPPGFGIPQEAPPSEDKPPPASKRFISALHEKCVTGDDIQEQNNKECLICLDEHEIGGMAVKLPCGHLYHRACVVEWLSKHCTCPVCRYEVECNDPRYEQGRKKRMQKTRKMRLRLDELKAMKIADLRTICSQLGVSISDCIDKREIIDKITGSGKVDIVEGVPLLNIPEDRWANMTVKDLRNLLKTYGISDEGALEKNELKGRLLDSGRVAIQEAPIASCDSSGPTGVEADEDEANPVTSTTSDVQAETSQNPASEIPVPEEETHQSLAHMTVASDENTKEVYTEYEEGFDKIMGAETGKMEIEESRDDSSTVAHESAVRNEEGGSFSRALRGEPSVYDSVEDSAPVHLDNSNSAGNNTSDITDTPSSSETFELGTSLLRSMSVREIKAVMEAYGISARSCVERGDLLERLHAHPNITVIQDD